MTERRCINCNDLMAEGDATVLYAEAKPVAWVHPTCLADYTTGADQGIEEGNDLSVLLNAPPRLRLFKG